jgi:hypothetical protein
MPNSTKLGVGLALALAVASATAGPLDPDCTPEKAAKSAAAKATVGVGGRCDAKEAAHDTAGLGDKDKKDRKDDKNDNEKKDNKDKKNDKDKKDPKKASDDDKVYKDTDASNGWSVSK